MSEFMKTLLSLSVSGTLLLLLIWGFKLLYKNRFSRRWQYYIWIIAVLRFLLPFTPDTTIVGNLFEKLNATGMTNESPASPNESMTNGSPASPNEAKTSENQASPNEPMTVNAGYSEIEHAQIDKSAPAAHNSFDTYVCLFWVWLAMALVLFIRRITIYQGFIRHIKAGNTEVSDIKTLNLLSDCKEKLDIKTRVALYHNVLIASPIMIGFFRPSIILPVAELEDKELSYIFAHELNHYKQRDMFYKWLIQIVICVHWFNPFVYLLEKEVNKACELSCDETVISALDDSARREYGEMLIKFLKMNNHTNNSLASVTLTEGAEQLKERLGAIMRFRKKTKLIVTISMIAAVLLSVGGFTIGAYAAQSGAKQSSSIILEKPPKLTVISDETAFDALLGTYSWTYSLNKRISNETSTCIEADSDHPLNCKDWFLKFETAEKTATLNFAENPDAILRIQCWSEEHWGNLRATGENVTFDGYEIELKPGGYIYEVTAEWNKSGYRGRAYYSFYVNSSDGEADYKSILLGKKDFICTDWANNKRLNIEEIKQAVTDEDGITVRAVKFAKLDLDGDGEDEVVLWLQVNGHLDYGFEVLHYHDGEVYGYTLPYRAFYELKTDGTFIYSGGAADSGIGKIKFSGTEYSIIEKGDYSGAGAQKRKTDVKWYELSDDNINAVFM